MAGNSNGSSSGAADSVPGGLHACSSSDQQDADGPPDQQLKQAAQQEQVVPEQQPKRMGHVAHQGTTSGQAPQKQQAPGPAAAFAKAKQQLVKQQEQHQKSQASGSKLLGVLQRKQAQQQQQAAKQNGHPSGAVLGHASAADTVGGSPGSAAHPGAASQGAGSSAVAAGASSAPAAAAPPTAARVSPAGSTSAAPATAAGTPPAPAPAVPAAAAPAKQAAKAAASKGGGQAASNASAQAAGKAATPAAPAGAFSGMPATSTPATPPLSTTSGPPGYGPSPKSGARPRSVPRSSSSGNASGSSYVVGSSTGGQGRFEPYMERALLQQEMKRGHVFRAKFRVNAANRTEAYCTLDNMPSDVMVRRESLQNRAVEGDVVAIQPLPLADWFVVHKETAKITAAAAAAAAAGEVLEEDALQRCDRLSREAIAAYDEVALKKAQEPWLAADTPQEGLEILRQVLRSRPDLRATAKVVAIIEPSPRRENLVGVLLPAGSNCLFLVPLDARMPRCIVQPNQVAELPQELREEAVREDVTQRTFVSALMGEWHAGHPYPPCTIRHSIGQAGGIESGTAAILAAENIRCGDFGADVYASLPKLPWAVTDADLAARRDLRGTRIFSIDPITAKDLDDALSIEPLPSGGFRVGVHIADVAAFVRPGTALDEEASLRGTSVYMVQRVIPMLPSLLCEQLCSLNPGQDRFAFSIIWELSPEGEIRQQWAGRSVINSCAKLAYPMVQHMIEGCFRPEDWQLKLFNGATWEQVIEDSLALNSIARCLRAKRFGNGALRLDNTRLCFQMDTAGNPVACAPYVQAEANQLVEEFMLLANQSVARFISDAFPDRAVLRRHPAPSERKMNELLALTKELGIALDASTAAALQRTLAAAKEAVGGGANGEALKLMLTKPMQLAQYFCTGQLERPQWRHFALAMEEYTHFTSPIRRYPDVLVHRLLAAALELQKLKQQQEAAVLAAATPPQRMEAGTAAPEVPQQQQELQQAASSAAADAPAAGSTTAAAANAACEGVLTVRAVSGPLTLRPAPGAVILAPTPVAQPTSHAAAGTAASTAAMDGSGTPSTADAPAQNGRSSTAAPAASAATPAATAGIDIDALLAKHGLPSADELKAITESCNDTRLAARNAQDQSLKLFLSVLLRDAPAVTEGVVVGLGGDKFLTVYMPEFGTEARIYLDQMGVPVRADFDAQSKTLTIHHLPPEEQPAATGNGNGPAAAAGSSSATASSAAGPGAPAATASNAGGPSAAAPSGPAAPSGGSFQRGGPSPQRSSGARGGRGNGRGNGRSTSAGGRAGSGGNGGSSSASYSQPDFDLQAWLATLQRLRNPRHLQPQPLPLSVRMFSPVTLVVGALISKVSGHPIDICARLYVQGMPAHEVEGRVGAAPDAAHATADEAATLSVLTADAMLED